MKGKFTKAVQPAAEKKKIWRMEGTKRTKKQKKNKQRGNRSEKRRNKQKATERMTRQRQR